MALPLIFLDLDGTLIGPDGWVSDRVWEAVDEVLAAGVTLAACTGRTRQGVAREIARRLGQDGFHVFDSGAVIASHDGRVLSAHRLDAGSLTRIIEHARRLGPETMVELYTPDGIYVERMTWRCKRHAEVLGLTVCEADLEEVTARGDVIRAHWIAPPEDLDEALSNDLPECQVAVASSPALPESMFASITAGGVSKGSAALEIARHIGVSLADAMAVGDSPGDLPVLEVVGHPRVMGDSGEALRQRFKTVPSVEEHGAIAALREALGL
jgi:Cof subfamily protein (haloacid dehalogenase superfamily)